MYEFILFYHLIFDILYAFHNNILANIEGEMCQTV